MVEIETLLVNAPYDIRDYHAFNQRNESSE